MKFKIERDVPQSPKKYVVKIKSKTPSNLNPTFQRTLDFVKRTPQALHEIASKMKKKLNFVSQHIKMLEATGCVKRVKKGGLP